MTDDSKSNEMKCLICNKTVRSDAMLTRFCALCGMGISDQNPRYETLEGSTLYFCCDKCLNIDVNNILLA